MFLRCRKGWFSLNRHCAQRNCQFGQNFGSKPRSLRKFLQTAAAAACDRSGSATALAHKDSNCARSAAGRLLFINEAERRTTAGVHRHGAEHNLRAARFCCRPAPMSRGLSAKVLISPPCAAHHPAESGLQNIFIPPHEVLVGLPPRLRRSI